MTRLRNLPDNARIKDVFLSRPKVFEPFARACDQIMRAPSVLSVGDRELLGAYVSVLNECDYCRELHTGAANAHGKSGDITGQLKQDIGSAAIDDKLKPLFRLSEKMTLNAYRITDKDLDDCYAAGWEDDAILDVISVTCMFNFMNRLVSSLDIKTRGVNMADWNVPELPQELMTAMSTEEFPKEGALLDIGCGSGNISARLAEMNYSVLGIDLAQNVINEAENTHKGSANLKFRAVDVCGDFTDLGKFHVLLDYNCLHNIPRDNARKYADNLARWAAPGAHYFLYFKTPPGKKTKVKQRRIQVRQYLGNLFKDSFRLKGMRPARIQGKSAEGREMTMPALAVWMIRK